MTRKTKFDKYITQYLLLQKDYLKESSYSIYCAYVYNKIIPYFGEVQLNQLNNELVQNFCVYLYTQGSYLKTSLSLSTTKSIMTFLCGSLEYLFKQNIIKSFNIKIKYPRNTKSKKLNIFTDNEIIILRDRLKQEQTPRHIGILITLYSGLRIGEIAALTWDDINLSANTISISKTLQRIEVYDNDNVKSKIIITTPKTPTSIRNIPINNELKLILTKYYPDDSSTYVLTNSHVPLEPRSLRYTFTSLLKKLGIEQRKFHTLRHTFATRLIKKTNDFKTVSELLGHSSISTTLDVYTHTTEEVKIKIINEF